VKSSRISRVVRILTALQAGNCAVDDLAIMSRTSRRTVFRDLKELRSIGVPYHYNATTGDYTIDPEFFSASDKFEPAGGVKPAAVGA
jgi:predicted DNA-binding transcriptional regulator YafY